MATLTLKDVPEELVAKLKAAALDGRRSLSQEALMRLQWSLIVRLPSSAEKIAIMRASRARFAHLEPFTAEWLQAAKEDGRS